jgi:hypothetical protein
VIRAPPNRAHGYVPLLEAQLCARSSHPNACPRKALLQVFATGVCHTDKAQESSDREESLAFSGDGRGKATIETLPLESIDDAFRRLRRNRSPDALCSMSGRHRLRGGDRTAREPMQATPAIPSRLEPTKEGQEDSMNSAASERLWQVEHTERGCPIPSAFRMGCVLRTRTCRSFWPSPRRQRLSPHGFASLSCPTRESGALNPRLDSPVHLRLSQWPTLRPETFPRIRRIVTKDRSAIKQCQFV